MRYSIPMAEVLDALCTAVDTARQALDDSLTLDDSEVKTWRGKLTSAWEMLLTLPDGTPREYLTLVVWPNGKTMLEIESRSDPSITYQVNAHQCQCRGARHVCDHRTAAQLVKRALEAIGSTERQAA